MKNYGNVVRNLLFHDPLEYMRRAGDEWAKDVEWREARWWKRIWLFLRG